MGMWRCAGLSLLLRTWPYNLGTDVSGENKGSDRERVHEDGSAAAMQSKEESNGTPSCSRQGRSTPS